MDAQARHHTVRRMTIVMQMMLMPMFNTHRNKIQRQLDEKPSEHQRAQHDCLPFAPLPAVIIIKLRQKMEQRQAEQKRARERVEQLHMPGLMQPETEHRESAQNDAGH